MEGVDGEPLKIFRTIAAEVEDLGEFGALLLNSKDQVEVRIIQRKHKNDSPEIAVGEFAHKWLTKGGPTCTYQHFIDCVRKCELTDLADKIHDAILKEGKLT